MIDRDKVHAERTRKSAWYRPLRHLKKVGPGAAAPTRATTEPHRPTPRALPTVHRPKRGAS